MKKNIWIMWLTFGFVTLIVLGFVINQNIKNPSDYGKSQEYSKIVNVTNWQISEGTANSFAEASCDKLAIGQMPAMKFQNEDHVKSSASVIAAYCPNSLHVFLVGVMINHPEYKETAIYINDILRVT